MAKQDPKTETVEEPKADAVTASASADEPTTGTAESLKAEVERLQKELKARNAEEAARRKKLEALEKAEEERQLASKTELEKAVARADKAERDARELLLQTLRRDIAAEIGLPKALADRLKGETPEDIKADATALLANLPAPVAPKLQPTNPGQPQTGETEAERKKRLGL